MNPYMQAGDWGFTFVFIPEVGPDYVDFTVATGAVLLAQPPNNGTLKTFTMTIALDKKSASYTFLPGNINVGGYWEMQVQSTAISYVLTSLVIPFPVGPVL